MTMEAKELMQGNYVLFHLKGEDNVITVTDITKGYIGCDEATLLAFKYIQPIPLTEDWLLKFGFVPLIQGTGFNTTEIVIFNPSDDQPYYKFIYAKWTVRIYYVHQLQNLYFALTQTHLTGK